MLLSIVFFSSCGSFTPCIFWKVHAARSENLPSALFLWQLFVFFFFFFPAGFAGLMSPVVGTN